MGYAPGSGFAPKLKAKGRTMGIAEIYEYRTAGRSPASDPAAKPQRPALNHLYHSSFFEFSQHLFNTLIAPESKHIL